MSKHTVKVKLDLSAEATKAFAGKRKMEFAGKRKMKSVIFTISLDPAEHKVTGLAT